MQKKVKNILLGVMCVLIVLVSGCSKTEKNEEKEPSYADKVFVEDILDTIEEIRQKAHDNPEAYPIDYTIRLIQGIVAKGFGFESRTEWTEELKQSPRSIYSKRLEENRFYI